MRDPFKQLLSNCKKNSVTQDENGNWNQIRSSTNRRRMNGDGASDQTKIWIPSKLLVTSEDLKMVWDKQKGKCYWFDIDLDLNLLYKDHKDWYPKHPLAPSVDKIDESGDYSINNIVICCRFALRDLANAMDNLRKGVGGAAGTGAEKKYQDAYLKCVRLELKPKMKRKI